MQPQGREGVAESSGSAQEPTRCREGRSQQRNGEGVEAAKAAQEHLCVVLRSNKYSYSTHTSRGLVLVLNGTTRRTVPCSHAYGIVPYGIVLGARAHRTAAAHTTKVRKRVRKRSICPAADLPCCPAATLPCAEYPTSRGIDIRRIKRPPENVAVLKWRFEERPMIANGIP